MADKYNFSDVFVSYARSDGEFVKTVVDVLFDRGYEVWIDWDDIPQTVDWWEEIKAGIDASNTFVFVITENSANSKVCYDEVQYAVDTNKRIVPLIPDGFDNKEAEEKLHPAIKTHNWFIFNRPEKTFAENIDRLLTTLMMDVDYLRMHTRYLVRAREWLENNSSTGFLLRGEDALRASNWLENNPEMEPAPTEIHRRYIEASMQQYHQDLILEQNKRTLDFIDLSMIPTVVITMFIFTYYGWLTFPESGVEGRVLLELSFGTSITAGILIGILIFYGDDLVRVRYPDDWLLRLGASFVFSFIVGSAFSGFIQVIWFGSRLGWLSVYANGLMLSIAPMLSTVFKLRGWQSVILACIFIFLGIQLNYQTDTALWHDPWIPVYHFETETQALWLGGAMAFFFAIAMYGKNILIDYLAWRKHREETEQKAV